MNGLMGTNTANIMVSMYQLSLKPIDFFALATQSSCSDCCYVMRSTNPFVICSAVRKNSHPLLCVFSSQFLFERVEGVARATIIDLDAHQVSSPFQLAPSVNGNAEQLTT